MVFAAFVGPALGRLLLPVGRPDPGTYQLRVVHGEQRLGATDGGRVILDPLKSVHSLNGRCRTNPRTCEYEGNRTALVLN
jgi:hypothetical protein